MKTITFNIWTAIWFSAWASTLILAAIIIVLMVYAHQDEITGYKIKLATSEAIPAILKYQIELCIKEGKQSHIYETEYLNGFCKPQPPIIVRTKAKKRLLEAAMGGG